MPVKIEKTTSFYHVTGGVFDGIADEVGKLLLTENEVLEFRDEADRLLPRYSSGPSEFEQGYKLAVDNGALIASKSRDINEDTLEALLDITDDYDRGNAVKAYLREAGVLR